MKIRSKTSSTNQGQCNKNKVVSTRSLIKVRVLIERNDRYAKFILHNPNKNKDTSG